jgi:tRNA wybutosine-synthesizing protein 2
MYSRDRQGIRFPKILKTRQTPFQKIQDFLITQNLVPKDLLSFLPQGWKKVGEVGILELDPTLHQWKVEIGNTYLKFVPELRTIALKVGTPTQPTRVPKFEIIAGNHDTVTLHKELGCKFWIDALKLTFSNGNHAERLRMIKLSKPEEQVVDMFACVGNLSIPLAVHNSSAKVIGVEINPEAHRFLEKNIKANNLRERYQAILGDNREVTPKDWADRVLMGFFSTDLDQISAGLASLKQKKGGDMHIHGLSSSRKPVDWSQKLTTIIEEEFPHFKIITSQKLTIKTVAPGILHFVNDFHMKSDLN